MRKFTGIFLLTILLLFSITSLLQAEDEIEVEIRELENNKKEEIRIEAVEVDEEIIELNGFDFQFVSASSIKANGGPMMGMLQLNIDEINDILVSAGFGELDDYIVLYGGGGIAGSRTGNRFGGYGLQGQVNSYNAEKRANLSINYGGFLYEKGLFAFRMTDLSAGFMLGKGTSVLELTYGEPSGSFEDNLDSALQNIFEKNYMVFEPKLTLNQKITSIVGLEISLGYLFTYDPNQSWVIAGRNVASPGGHFHGPNTIVKLSFGF